MGLKPDSIPPGWLEPNLGPGVSRPKPDESTRLFRVHVRQTTSPAMRVTIPAPNKTKALLYCKNRWPDCTAEVIE
jgi:hypothetical protein